MTRRSDIIKIFAIAARWGPRSTIWRTTVYPCRKALHKSHIHSFTGQPHGTARCSVVIFNGQGLPTLMVAQCF